MFEQWKLPGESRQIDSYLFAFDPSLYVGLLFVYSAQSRFIRYGVNKIEPTRERN